ncbi:hypothetical protein [Geoglobus sp.]
MELRKLFPRMHGATSIWFASMILALPELSPVEFLSSLSVFFAVAAGHNVIFKGKASFVDYAVLLASSLLIASTSLWNHVVLIYSIPLVLSLIFRGDFRKYVIFSSLLTTIPASYISDTSAFLAFVSFAFAGVLLADSFIYSDRRTAAVGVIQYFVISLLTYPLLVIFTLALVAPFLVRMSLKTLGMYLLAVVTLNAVSLLLIIYHV